MAPFPVADSSLDNPGLSDNFAQLQELVQSVRTLRSEFNLPPSKKIKVRVKTGSAALAEFFSAEAALIASLVQSDDMGLLSDGDALDGSVGHCGQGI